MNNDKALQYSLLLKFSIFNNLCIGKDTFTKIAKDLNYQCYLALYNSSF